MPDKKPDVVKMYQRCGQCIGTGRVQPPELPEEDCPSCAGEGYREVFQVDMSDIESTLTDIRDDIAKCSSDILDKCDDILTAINAL